MYLYNTLRVGKVKQGSFLLTAISGEKIWTQSNERSDTVRIPFCDDQK